MYSPLQYRAVVSNSLPRLLIVPVLMLIATACGPSGPSSPPSIVSFTASPTSLPFGGGTAELSWVQANATSLTINNGVGTVSSLTQTSVNVTATTTYTLTATNSLGTVTATATVTVVPDRLLCVSNAYGDTITSYPTLEPGDTAPVRQFGGMTKMELPTGIYVDNTNNEIGVVSEAGESVTIYSRTGTGNLVPSRVLIGPATEISFPMAVAIDPVNQEIAVVNNGSAYGGAVAVTVYPLSASGNVTPTRVLTGPATGMSSPVGIYIDPTNNEIGVANQAGTTGVDSVLVFARTASGNQAPKRTYSGAATELSSPAGVYVDTSDSELGVTNSGNNTVTVFNLTVGGNVAPKRVIAGAATTLSNPTGIYYDAANSLIGVSNKTSSTLAMFQRLANGNQAPAQTIAGTATTLAAPVAVYFDSVNSEIGVLNQSTSGILPSISVFSAATSGNAGPSRTIGEAAGPGVIAPYGLFVDNVNNQIAVASAASNFGFTDAILFYSKTANGAGATPTTTISGPATALSAPGGIYVDTAANEVGVTNITNNTITVYDRATGGNQAPKRTIGGALTTLATPFGIYLDSVNSQIGVANEQNGTIAIFDESSTGNVAPVRTISGAATTLANPYGIALDSVNDEIAVADITTHSVVIFASNASGNAAPKRVLSGPLTGLQSPTAVAIDTVNDEITVIDVGNASDDLQANDANIFVFSRTATGNATPLRVIGGSSTNLFLPIGIGLCN